MGVGQSLMLSGAWSTKNQNTNNHQVFVHFVLMKDSLNYQLELVVNAEPLYSRQFLSKRCNTWSTLLRVVPPLLPLLNPWFLIVRSKKSNDLLKNGMFISSSPILQNWLNLTPFSIIFNIFGFYMNRTRLVLLGSKDLGFYVFRTLICIVGKPWSKQCV